MVHYIISTPPQIITPKRLVHQIYRTCHHHILQERIFLTFVAPSSSLLKKSSTLAAHRPPLCSPLPENFTKRLLFSPEDPALSAAIFLWTLLSYLTGSLTSPFFKPTPRSVVIYQPIKYPDFTNLRSTSVTWLSLLRSAGTYHTGAKNIFLVLTFNIFTNPDEKWAVKLLRTRKSAVRVISSIVTVIPSYTTYCPRLSIFPSLSSLCPYLSSFSFFSYDSGPSWPYSITLTVSIIVVRIFAKFFYPPTWYTHLNYCTDSCGKQKVFQIFILFPCGQVDSTLEFTDQSQIASQTFLPTSSWTPKHLSPDYPDHSRPVRTSSCLFSHQQDAHCIAYVPFSYVLCPHFP